jgi:hypothetical protein
MPEPPLVGTADGVAKAEPVAAAAASAEAAPLSWGQTPALQRPPRRAWHVGLAAAFLAMGIIFLSTWIWQSFPGDAAPVGTAAPVVSASDTGVAANPSREAPAMKSAAPVAAVEAAPQTVAQTAAKTAPPTVAAQTGTGASSLRLEASELTWVSIRTAEGQTLLSRLFSPGQEESLALPGRATLRVGNAGGLQVQLNGQSVGPIGDRGQVKEIVFHDGGFRISDVAQH